MLKHPFSPLKCLGIFAEKTFDHTFVDRFLDCVCLIDLHVYPFAISLDYYSLIESLEKNFHYSRLFSFPYIKNLESACQIKKKNLLQFWLKLCSIYESIWGRIAVSVKPLHRLHFPNGPCWYTEMQLSLYSNFVSYDLTKVNLLVQIACCVCVG